MLENTQVLENQVEEMPSLNHSYICAQIMRQLLQDNLLQPLPELTLDIDDGLTPDISVYKEGKKLFHEEMVESEGVKVDFTKVFKI